jgi:hypothetical protein
VIREAFDDADDTMQKNSSWTVSQIAFAAGDVSAASMGANDSGAKSIYRHCVRFTNYFSRFDEALDISNVKRVGIAPRVGRVGLPSDAPTSAVNVNCSDYYQQLSSDTQIAQQDEPAGIAGMKSHSWYFGNALFTRDLFSTLIGVDRNSLPTRRPGSDGVLRLTR